MTATGTSSRFMISKTPARRMARSVEFEPRQRPVLGQRLADDRIDGLLVLDDAGEDGAEPLRVGLAIERAVDFLAEPEGLVFGGDLEHAAAGDVHLVERLHGRQPGGAALVGLPHRAAGRPPGWPDMTIRLRGARASAIMVRAARAAKPPLSPSVRRARTQACSSFSVVRMPLPIASESCDRQLHQRARRIRWRRCRNDRSRRG